MPRKKRHRKTCAVCGRVVYPDTGTYYYGKLVHKRCKGLMKRYPWRFK